MLKPRKVIDKIKRYLEFPEAIILIGARQVGKTSVMKLLQNELKTNFNTFFYDLEHRELFEQFNKDFNDVLDFLYEEGIDKSKRNFIFLDEIQYLDDPSNLIKLLVDDHPEIKLIASGSSTLKIKQKFKDALVGRKIEFQILPLDFEEYLDFIGENKYLQLLKKNHISSLNHQRIQNLFFEYLTFGGYPRIALTLSKRDKEKLLNEIVQSYIFKDISYLFKIENLQAFNLLLKLLANQCGQLLNLQQVQNDLKINRQTLERYLFVLENTFIIKRIFPYFSNKSTEISKMQKLFFLDNGIRNILQRNFNSIQDRNDRGELLENGIYTELLKNIDLLDEIKYWRTKSGNEVDFIINGEKLFAIEIKWQEYKSNYVPNGIKFFKKKYRTEESFLVHQGQYKKEERMIRIPHFQIGSLFSKINKP
ncbi:MAG: ATP-binding protein [Candidatus Cloacimonetes bacterium]|nr:ATP-binding protein [Candidatus Cloacimonadota bacterium]